MALPLITSVLSGAGSNLLEYIAEHAQERGEATDDPVFIIIEHWILELLDEIELTEIIDAAQDAYLAHGSDHMHQLELFATLIEYGGDQIERFAENMWLAYFFHMEQAAHDLWNHYSEIQRNVVIETGRNLHRSWGEWLPLILGFAGLIEELLIDADFLFDRLFTSEDVLQLLSRRFATQPSAEISAGLDDSYLPPEPFNAAATLNAYLTACRQDVGQIDPRGYQRSVRTTVPLSDVFVEMRLVPLTALGTPDNFMRYRTATCAADLATTLRTLPDHRTLLGHPGLQVSEALNHQRQVLILGEIGSGKTTILRHLVLEHARLLLEDLGSDLEIITSPDGSFRFRLSRLLPVYIDMAVFVEQRQEGESLLSFALRNASMQTRDESAGRLIESLLETGQCLILLDGLDHVVSDEQRRMLTLHISEATEAWREAGNRIVVTSRVSEYEATPLSPEFSEYIVRPLNRSQINSLLLRWKLTLARVERPLIGDDEGLRNAHAETLSLVREISSDPRLQVLAGNPLLLRMLVQVYRSGTMISAQRIAIYKMVADALLREWRLPRNNAGEMQVSGKEAEYLLAELAAWLHTSRPSGTLNENELRQILGHIWAQMHPDATTDQVVATIGDFLGQLRMRPGVLVELASQQYGFVFQGLQEYFAARYIVSSYRQAPGRIRAHLHDPRWNEVIVLAIGLAALRSHEDATDLIETAILARGPGAAERGYRPSLYENLLNRDIFFVSRLLAANIEVHPELAQLVIERLMQLWLDGERNSIGRFTLAFDMARRQLINLSGTPYARRAFQIALDNLSAGGEYRQAYAVDALTFWPEHLTDARDALVDLGRNAPPLVRSAIAEALGRVGELNRDAYVLLLGLVADPDERVGENSQRVLASTTPIPYEALSLWVEYLHSGDPVRQRLSLRMLNQVGTLPPMVIAELLNLLDSAEASVRQRTVDVLAGVNNLPDDALTTICRMISDEDPCVREAAIRAMQRPVTLPAEIIQQLVRWTNDPDVRVRRAATEALGVCLNNETIVLEALVERLGDPVDSIRESVITPLVVKGGDNSRVLHILTHIVRDPIYGVRCRVASALRHFKRPNHRVRELIDTLLNDREVIVRETILGTISEMSDPGADIIEYLVDLTDTPDAVIGEPAVRALAALRGLPDSALGALVHALPYHWETAGDEIVKCMQAHAPLNPEIVFQVMDLGVSRNRSAAQIARIPIRLRTLALGILGYAFNNAPVAFQVLLDATKDGESPEVRAAAVQALAHSRTMSPSIKRTLLRLAKRGAPLVRSAAGISLGQLVYNLPDHALTGEELLDLSEVLSDLLAEIPPRAAWEQDTELQNQVYAALQQVVSRTRPALLQLPPRSEDPGSDLYE